MRYAELNVFGVFIAPIAPMFILAWVLLMPLRLLADRSGLLSRVWHPALFVFAIYIIFLSAIVLVAGMIGV